ncbi:M48 family metallopeptidase [Candidatus Collierbacteria bacterium]|nr:M48 family metallopeptidase [Candidatus Collierbacteria bacterium]
MIDYKVIRNSRRRFSSSISVTADRGVIVSVPKWVSLGVIEDMVRVKADWIAKALARLGGVHQQSKKRFVDGEKHLYFGEEYPLTVVPSTGIATARLAFQNGSFEAKVPGHHTPIQQRKDLKEAMLRWYLDNGKRIITQKVNHFTKLLGVSYNRIVLKKVSSIWGSCSRKNNLNFNRKLIMAPHEVVDYVVVHEVCHLVHHHHRKVFWDLVKSLEPNYKERILWLKKNQYLLTI